VVIFTNRCSEFSLCFLRFLGYLLFYCFRLKSIMHIVYKQLYEIFAPRKEVDG
jgi:hypothetical protein